MAEWGRPDADAHVGNFTDQDGGTSSLYASLDEVAPDVTDYVESPTEPSSEPYACQLSEAEGASASLTQLIRYRYGTDGGALDLTVQLREGYVSEASQGTLIATWSHAGVTDAQVGAAQTLSAGEKASITDYSDLFLRFVWST